MPLELRKDIERIHRNLGHASADQLEKLFRGANVSDDAIWALKHFRCDASDRLKQPPSKRKVAVNHAETFNDIVSMDVSFWKITFKESPRVKTTLEVLNIVDAASGMLIAIQIAAQTAETIWRAFATGWLEWLEAQDVFELIRTGLRSPGVSSTKQKDEAYLWNQHRLKHTDRWDTWKTMPGT